MTITATQTSHPTPAITSYISFTFDDGVTVRVSGGLICSIHGRRVCRHHKAAHAAIISRSAASSEAATAVTDAEMDELLTADAAAYDAFLSAVEASTPAFTPDWLETAETDEDDSADACDLIDTPFFSSLY